MTASHTIGTQAGIFDTRAVATYVLELLEKCHEIHDVFKKCQEDLIRGRDVINQNEQVVGTLKKTIEKFGDTMDTLGMNLLQDNMSLVKVNAQIDKAKRDISAKKERLSETESHHVHTERWERVNELRQERDKLEIQLRKVNDDIDTKYEEMYDAEEKLCAIKEIRAMKRDEHERHLATLRDKSRDTEARKRELLQVTEGGTMDMSQMYVSPADFRRLETEIQDMRHQQIQVDRHIQMQLDERQFLRDTANAILQRVYDLERKVRKETGDHGWESALTTEPNWYSDLGAPSMWYMAPPLSVNQLKWMRERQNRKFVTAHVNATEDEKKVPTTSGTVSEDMVVIDLLNAKEDEV